ncbi:hypothetical protein GGR57DRAFT_251917 [Xylariaceae sp. FL1272]|nr:hypothetical protein GGR57DRAFT_251917 [Xylariaceae sp. FL1272]
MVGIVVGGIGGDDVRRPKTVAQPCRSLQGRESPAIVASVAEGGGPHTACLRRLAMHCTTIPSTLFCPDSPSSLTTRQPNPAFRSLLNVAQSQASGPGSHASGHHAWIRSMESWNDHSGLSGLEVIVQLFAWVFQRLKTEVCPLVAHCRFWNSSSACAQWHDPAQLVARRINLCRHDIYQRQDLSSDGLGKSHRVLAVQMQRIWLCVLRLCYHVGHESEFPKTFA